MPKYRVTGNVYVEVTVDVNHEVSAETEDDAIESAICDAECEAGGVVSDEALYVDEIKEGE